MNAKEVVFSSIDMKMTERLPAAVFGGGIWTYYQYGEEPGQLVKNSARMSDILIEMGDRIESDIVYTGSGLNNCLLGALGGAITFKKVGAPEVEPFVNSIDDLEELDLNNIESDSIINSIWETARNVSKAIGEKYVVTMTSWGPFVLAGQLLGVEKLMKATFKNRNLVKALCEFTNLMILRFYEPLLQEGVISMVSIADSLSSANLISRKQFEELGLPPLKTLFSGLKSKGAKILLHMCGDMSDRLDLVSTSGCDIISLDAMVDLRKAKEVFKGKCVLAGNVSPTDVLMSGDPDMVRAAVLTCADEAAEGGGYMVMPACDLPLTVPIENVKTFLETARNYEVN
jgi:uroporphyrinogen decarboxylase